jgi:hypothetical protein
MKKIEIIVGLFVLSGLIGVFFLAFRIGKSEFIGREKEEEDKQTRKKGRRTKIEKRQKKQAPEEE